MNIYQDWKVKLESVYFFMLKYSKITVWFSQIGFEKTLNGTMYILFNIIFMSKMLIKVPRFYPSCLMMSHFTYLNVSGTSFFSPQISWWCCWCCLLVCWSLNSDETISKQSVTNNVLDRNALWFRLHAW